MRAALGRRGARNAGRGCPTMGTHGETEVLGRYDLVDEEKYTGRVTAPTTRQHQVLVRRGPGPAAGGEAALWNLCAAWGREVNCNIRRKNCCSRWHFSHNPPAAEKPVAMDGREAAGDAANLHAGGWSD